MNPLLFYVTLFLFGCSFQSGSNFSKPLDAPSIVRQAILEVKLEGLGSIEAMAFDPKNSVMLAVAGGFDHRYMNAQTGEIVWSVKSTGYPSAIAVDFSPDGKFVSFLSREGEITTRLVANGNVVNSTKLSNESAGISLKYSSDGKALLLGVDRKVVMVNSATLEPFATYDGALDYVVDVNISKNGQYVSGSDNYNIYIWNFLSGKLIQRVNAGYSFGKLHRISPDYKFIAIGAFESIQLFEFSTGTYVHSFEAHKNYVTGLEFSSDLCCIFSFGNDSAIRVWDILQGKEIESLLLPASSSAKHLKVSADQRFLAASQDDFLRVYKIRNN